MKKLAGVTFIRNGHKLDYCFEAAIKSMQAVCETVIVVYCQSDDETLETLKVMDGPLELLICTEDLWQSRQGREKLSFFQNIAIDYAQRQGYEYCLLVQADEVLHEDSIPFILQALRLNEEAYYVSRYNLWRDENSMLCVPHSRKPVSTLVCRLAKSGYRTSDDGESFWVGEASSLDYINLIEIFHAGFIRNPKKHIAKIKEMQKNIFQFDRYDKRADLKPEFDWKDWGFTESDLVSIPKPLPIFLKQWVKNNK